MGGQASEWSSSVSDRRETKKIRVGMVGGGLGAFIGEVHRIAMRISAQYDLCAACFSSDPERARLSARELGVDEARSYADYTQMAEAESRRDDGIQAVIIVTPNYLHFPIAVRFLQAGMHVICDKPVTISRSQAEELMALSRHHQRQLWVTYNYTAYPMVREARARIARGDLGQIRTIQVEYSQDWLATAIEQEGQKQASWRTDPAKAGAAGCLGDIGVHAFNLIHYVTGLRPARLAADLHCFVEGRLLDDFAQVWMHYAQGARANLQCTQVAVGKENQLGFRIVGERGALEWQQEEPNHLWMYRLNGETQRCSRARHHVDASIQSACLIPAGHPEGYLEAFALLYTDIAKALRSPFSDVEINAQAAHLDMCFIEACLDSQARGNAWVEF